MRVDHYWYKVTPGTVILDKMGMRNVESDIAVDLGVEVRLWRDSPDVSSWFEFPNSAFTIPPTTTQELEFRVSVPEDVAPGTYGGNLNLLLAPDPDANTGNMAVAVASSQKVVIEVVEGDAGYYDYTGVDPVEGTDVSEDDVETDYASDADEDEGSSNMRIVLIVLAVLVVVLALVFGRRKEGTKK